MPTVTPPSISALPAAPDPNDRSTFNGRAYPWSAALPTFGTQVSAVATNVKANADDAAASATAASGYVATVAASASAAAQSVADAAVQAGIAQGAANNKGNWSALTGALNMPASVVHAGKIWVLRVNLANVTTSTPGVTADWLDISPASAFQNMAVLTSGTSWVCPAGVSRVKLRMAGGGGGAGGTSGGDAGGYLEAFFNVTAGISYTYAIGSGGSAGIQGGTTTFTANGVTYSCTGGLGGPGGIGGTATNGLLNLTGHLGQSSSASSVAGNGGVSPIYHGSGGNAYYPGRNGAIILEW